MYRLIKTLAVWDDRTTFFKFYVKKIEENQLPVNFFITAFGYENSPKL
jgi:hypothetical protein